MCRARRGEGARTRSSAQRGGVQRLPELPDLARGSNTHAEAGSHSLHTSMRGNKGSSNESIFLTPSLRSACSHRLQRLVACSTHTKQALLSRPMPRNAASDSLGSRRAQAEHRVDLEGAGRSACELESRRAHGSHRFALCGARPESLWRVAERATEPHDSTETCPQTQQPHAGRVV